MFFSPFLILLPFFLFFFSVDDRSDIVEDIWERGEGGVVSCSLGFYTDEI